MAGQRHLPDIASVLAPVSQLIHTNTPAPPKTPRVLTWLWEIKHLQMSPEAETNNCWCGTDAKQEDGEQKC